MARKPKNDAASVRARLQDLAGEQQANFKRVLPRYTLERFLFRRSVSPHKEPLVLKVAMSYAAWLEDPFRTTRDLVLLSIIERQSTWDSTTNKMRLWTAPATDSAQATPSRRRMPASRFWRSGFRTFRLSIVVEWA